MSQVNALRFLTEDLSRCETGNELLAVIDSYIITWG